MAPTNKNNPIQGETNRETPGEASKKTHDAARDEQRLHELLDRLLSYLTAERRSLSGSIPPEWEPGPDATLNDKWLAYRSLANVREALPLPDGYLADQDELLQALIAADGIVYLNDTEQSPLDPRLHLWRGDITRLATDAIVNAANSGMTGCWAPLHYCIDNAIHTFAGTQLRLECAAQMREQGRPEPTASARITGAFNLPSRHIVHTVGPIANGNPTDAQRRELARCYEACLDAAAKAGDSSIAFCCISTGVFGFPQAEAATIAVDAVHSWLASHPGTQMQVVFNVFSPEDEALYRRLLRL